MLWLNLIYVKREAPGDICNIGYPYYIYLNTILSKSRANLQNDLKTKWLFE